MLNYIFARNYAFVTSLNRSLEPRNFRGICVHCPRNNLNLCIKTEPVTVGVDAVVLEVRVYVWIMCQTYQYSYMHTFALYRFIDPVTISWALILKLKILGRSNFSRKSYNNNKKSSIFSRSFMQLFVWILFIW